MRIVGCGIPQTQGGVRQVKKFLQALGQDIRQVDIIARQQQRAGPGLEFARDRIVFLRYAHQVGHAQFQQLVFFPDDFHLPLLQRNGAAQYRAGQFDGGQQFRMLFKEMRVLGQVVRYVVRIHG